jgi:tetratricopeptide (TPR) repeat protein
MYVCTQVVEAYEAMPSTSATRKEALRWRHNFIIALHGSTGSLDEVRPLLEELAQRCQKELGDEDDLTQLVRYRYGEVLHKMRINAEAEPVLRDVLRLRQKMKMNAASDFLTLRCEYQLADLEADGPFSREVVDRLDEAIKGMGSCPEWKEGDKLGAKQRLAQVLLQGGKEEDKERAEALLNEVKEGFKSTSDVGSFNARQQMADKLVAREEYEEALKVLGPLEEWEETLGPQHPGTGGATIAMAIAKAALRRYKEAEDLYRRVIGAGAYKDDSEALLLCRIHVAYALYGQSKFEEARDELRSALDAGKAALGDNHSTVLKCKRDLGGVLMRLRVLGQDSECDDESLEAVGEAVYDGTGNELSALLELVTECLCESDEAEGVQK